MYTVLFHTQYVHVLYYIHSTIYTGLFTHSTVSYMVLFYTKSTDLYVQYCFPYTEYCFISQINIPCQHKIFPSTTSIDLAHLSNILMGYLQSHKSFPPPF